MKRILSTLLCFILLLSLLPSALAETDEDVSAVTPYVYGANYGDITVNIVAGSEDGPSESIQSYTSLGDELYMTTYALTELYVQKAGAEGCEIYPLNVDMDMESDNGYTSALFTDGERLLMLLFMGNTSGDEYVQSGVLTEVVIEDGEANAQPLMDVDMSLFRGSWSSPFSWVGTAAYAVGMYYSDSGDERACVLDLQTGSIRDADIDMVFAACPMDAESVAVERFDWNDPDAAAELLRYTPATGSMEPIGRVTGLSNGVSGLAYDPETDTFYGLSEGETHVLDLDQGAVAESVTDFPMESYQSNYAAVLTGGYYACAAYNGYFVRALHGENSIERKIKIYDMTWNSAVTQAANAFAAKHSDAAAIIAHDHTGSIIDEMMNHDNSVDVYVLYSNNDSYEALRDRGYLADFAESEALMAFADRLPANVLEGLSSDGRFAALPIEAMMSQIRFTRPVLERLGYTEADVPTSWMGLIDFLLKLSEELPEGETVLLADPWNSIENVRSDFMNQIFLCYQMTLKYAPEYARAEDMVEILNKLDSIDFSRFGLYHRDVVDDESFSVDYEYENILMEWNMYGGLGGMVNWRSIPVVLGLTDDSPRFINTECSVAIINPYSENRDLALSFMELLLDNMDVYTRYTLLADEREPVVNPYHDESMASMQAYIDELNAQLEDADPQDKQLLEEEIAAQQGYMEEIEKEIWMISEDDIAWRDENLQYLKISTVNWLYANDAGDAWDLIDQYAQGQLSPDRLMAEIDRKVRMRILENS